MAEPALGSGGAEALWRDELPKPSGASEAGGEALDARLSWSFALTPFAEAGLAGGDDRRPRLGTRFEARRGALALAGERHDSSDAQPEHAVRVGF